MLFRRAIACLCLGLFPFAAVAADLTLSLAGNSKNIIVTEVDAMARVMLQSDKAQRFNLVTMQFDGLGNYDPVKISKTFPLASGENSLPNGIIIIGAGTIGLFPSRNLQGVYPSRTLKLGLSGGALGGDAKAALMGAIDEATQKLPAGTPGVLAVILPEGTEMITQGIILIGGV